MRDDQYERSEMTGQGVRKFSVGERALGAGAVTMAVGAFLGHAVFPDRVAAHYGWPRERWYQREIGAFNAGLAYGVVAYARGRHAEAFTGSWGVAALLMAATRAAALRSGDRWGRWNVATVVEDAALGVGAFVLLARHRRATAARAPEACATELQRPAT
jgi:hypothetical protein